MVDVATPAPAPAEVVVDNEDWLGVGRDDLGFPGDPPAPAAVVPSAPVAAPAPAAPAPAPVAAAPAQATPATPEPTDAVKAAYAQNQQLQETVQTLVTEQARLLKVMADKEARETAPSAEELEAQNTAAREQLLADPGKVLQERESKLREQMTAEAGVKAREALASSLGYENTRDLDIAVASANGVKRLTADKEQFPLMQDAAFRAEMAKPENLAAVFKQYKKDSDPAEILKQDAAWALMYNRTALARATQNPAAAAPAVTAQPAGEEPINPVSAAPASAGAGAVSAPKSSIELEWDALAASDSPVLQ